MLKNKLAVGLLSAMLAFTGLACAGDDTADTDTELDTDAGITGTETPADDGLLEPTDEMTP